MSRDAARTVLRVDFEPERPQCATQAPTGRIPRVSRMLALAHTIDIKIRNGELNDMTDAAAWLYMTRARMTQVTSLLLLAPEIQEAILDLPLVINRADPVTERRLRPITSEPDWNTQLEMWRKIDGNA